MKRNFLAIWFLLVGVVLAQGGWYQLKEATFTADFPSEPKKTDAAVWELDHGGNSFRLSVDPCDLTPEETFAQAKQEFSKEFKFVSEKDGSVDGFPSKRYRYDISGRTMECLVVVRKDKLYMLMALVGGPAADVDKVFSSLHLI